jgi:hypothetical protein
MRGLRIGSRPGSACDSDVPIRRHGEFLPLRSREPGDGTATLGRLDQDEEIPRHT